MYGGVGASPTNRDSGIVLRKHPLGFHCAWNPEGQAIGFCEEDLHLQAVKHARHTKLRAALAGRPFAWNLQQHYCAAGLGWGWTGAFGAVLGFASRPFSMVIMNGFGV
jgi:hypothetical protein